MKVVKKRTLLVFSAAIGLGAVLLHTSQAVQDAEHRLHGMHGEHEKLVEGVRVLEAEWEYLNAPQRLEVLAREHLQLAPPKPEQMGVPIYFLPEAMPISGEVAAPSSDVTSLHSVSFEGEKKPSAVMVKPTSKPSFINRRKDESFQVLMKKMEDAP